MDVDEVESGVKDAYDDSGDARDRPAANPDPKDEEQEGVIGPTEIPESAAWNPRVENAGTSSSKEDRIEWVCANLG